MSGILLLILLLLVFSLFVCVFTFTNNEVNAASSYYSSILRKIVKEDIKIDIEQIEADDVELLQDMIMVSVNDAINQINKETEAKMGKYTQGMPGLF